MSSSPAGSPNRRRSVQYQGPKNEHGSPHGFGILVTDLVYYKGDFTDGKFDGRGFLRRFGPQGSAPASTKDTTAVVSLLSTSSPGERPGTAGGSFSNGSFTDAASPPRANGTLSPPQVQQSTVTPARPGTAGGNGTPKAVSPHGSRVAVWTYLGDFRGGKRHGHGKILFHRTQEHYDGEWAFDEMKGNGTYTLPATGVYVGGMHKNRRHGIGTMMYVDGSGYRGHWAQDVIHGAGRLVEANGGFYDGHWNRGVMNGTFFKTKASGSVYRQQYLDGRCILDEKKKGRDLYQRLFEAAPRVLTTAERLAEIFPPKPDGQPNAGEGDDGAADPNNDFAGNQNESVTGDGETTVASGDGSPAGSPRVRTRTASIFERRPGSASFAMSRSRDFAADPEQRETTFSATNLEIVDLDDDGELGGTPPETPAHDALIKNRSFVQPLKHVIDELKPKSNPSFRRPHTADHTERPWSAEDEAEDKGVMLPSPDKTPSPTNASRTHRHGASSAAAELGEFDSHFSPNGTMAELVTSPRTMGETYQPGPAVRDLLSPTSLDAVNRMTTALLQEAERLGEAPVPRELVAGSGDGGDAHLTNEEFYEQYQQRRREAELDRKASEVFRRHDTFRSVATPKAGPASSPPLGRLMSSVSMISSPTHAGSHMPPGGTNDSPVLPSNFSTAFGVSTSSFVANGSMAGPMSIAAPATTPAQVLGSHASMSDFNNFSFVGGSFAFPVSRHDSLPATGRPPLGRTPRSPPSEAPALFDSSLATPVLTLPLALRQRSEDPDELEATVRGGTFDNNFALRVLSDGSSDYTGSPTAQPETPPKMPEAPPSIALYEKLQRLQSGVLSPPTGSAASPTGGGPMRPRSRSVKFETPLAETTDDNEPPPANVLPSRSSMRARTASMILSATSNGSEPASPAASATPKHGRRSGPMPNASFAL
jgi:hypothetical protein